MDALAQMADEGRGKTAKCLGELSNKHNRGFPNGVTHPDVNIGIALSEPLG